MEHVKATTPKMNPDIVNGLAVKMLPKALEHLDAVVKSVAKDFIPGLRYVGFERCTPEEELRKTNNKKNDKYVVETAKSSIYLVKLKLAYTDPKAISLIQIRINQLNKRNTFNTNIIKFRNRKLIYRSRQEYYRDWETKTGIQ